MSRYAAELALPTQWNPPLSNARSVTVYGLNIVLATSKGQLGSVIIYIYIYIMVILFDVFFLKY